MGSLRARRRRRRRRKKKKRKRKKRSRRPCSVQFVWRSGGRRCARELVGRRREHEDGGGGGGVGRGIYTRGRSEHAWTCPTSGGVRRTATCDGPMSTSRWAVQCACMLMQRIGFRLSACSDAPFCLASLPNPAFHPTPPTDLVAAPLRRVVPDHALASETWVDGAV